MLIDSSRYFVFGTDVLLLGCKHYQSSTQYRGKYISRESELYATLRNFSPDALLIELGESTSLSGKISINTDINTLEKYVEDTKDARLDVYKHDMNRDKINIRSLPSSDITRRSENPTKEAVQYREMLKKESPDAFQDMLSKRETHSAIEFLSFLGKYESVAIHCGVLHFPAYEEYLRLLSDVRT